jgi:hypothetical protein
MEKLEEPITPGTIEDILRSNKRTELLLSLEKKEETDKKLAKVCSLIKEKGLAQKKASDLFYLLLYAPNCTNEIIDIASKIEETAEQKGTGFKDVIYTKLKKEGIARTYPGDCLDFSYLINSICILGGLKCYENNEYFIKLAKQNEIMPGSPECNDLVFFYGLERMKGLLGMNGSVSSELKRELLGKNSTPLHGYTNLMDLNREEHIKLPRKL